MERRRVITTSWWPVAAIVAIGLAITGIAFRAVQEAEDIRIREALEVRVDWRAKDIERKVDAARETLNTSAVFVSTQDAMDVREFRRFTARAHRLGQPIAAVDWVPRVTRDQRADFEREVSRERSGTFVILERTADRQLGPAADRPEYFPVLLQTRYQEMASSEGFDLASEPVRAEALARARDVGRPRATLGTQGLSGVGQTYLAFWPIYNDATTPRTIEERRAQLRGFVLGVFRVSDVLAAAIADTPEIVETINFYLGDDRLADWERTSAVVATYSPDAGKFLPGPRHLAVVSHRFVRSFDIMGQRWGMEFLFSPEAVAGGKSYAPLATLLAGILLTAALSAYAVRERRQRATVEAVVVRRTSELIQAQADTEAARTRMADWAQASTDWFWESDIDHRLTFVSDGFEATTGFKAEIRLGQRRFDTLPNPDPADTKWQAHLDEQAAHRPFRDFVTPFDGFGGRRYMSISGKPTFDDNGKFLGYRGTTRDVTAQIEAEHALARQTEIFSTLIENLPIGISLFSADHKLVAFNKPFVEIPGYPAELVRPGVSLEQLIRFSAVQGEFGPGDPELLVRERGQIADQHRSTQFERRCHNGRMVEFRHVPMPDGGFVTTRIDVTEKRRIEERMAQAQKIEAVGQLSGGIAHEFNNLLGVVIGNLDIQSEVLDGASEAKELNAEALAAALRGSVLVSRLLAFSRNQPLRPARLELGQVVRGLEPLLAHSLGNRIVIQIETPGDLWPVTADQSQFESAVTNLALNARDAMPQGGSLMIACANVVLDAAAAGSIGDLPAGEYVTVTVRDTGTGIAPDVLPKVFEPFFTTKQVDQGSGLGLSMVHGYARQSGGTVTIYSELGHGTEVRLYLPRRHDEPVAPRIGDEASGPASTGRERILVVEDKDDVRKMAVLLLDSLGYRTTAADNAAAALNLLDDGAEFDLLFTDIMMPGEMNGIGLANEIRRRFPSMPIVFTSGFSNPETIHARAVALGATIISKPYRKATLAESLRAALAARRDAT